MQAEEAYRPCHNGIHICGKSPDETEPVTLANFRMSPAQAVRLFSQLKEEFGEASDEDGDMVVDLCIRGDIEDDFWIRRQMLDRVSQTIVAAGSRPVAQEPVA